jgi:hypothetical protein
MIEYPGMLTSVFAIYSSNHDFEHNELKCLNKKGFLFIHLNVRSLRNKLSELQLIANQAKVAVISVTESWFDESIANTEVSIPGYSTGLIWLLDRILSVTEVSVLR